MTNELVLDAPGARLVVSAVDGGRMCSLVVRGQELLVPTGGGTLDWGCYPMVPFAGRIRDGRFSFEGHTVQLPRNLPPNAIHGTVLERTWRVAGPEAMSVDLGPAWPFAGRVTQTFALREDGLDVRLRLEAHERMPVTLGWHPWFRRRLGPGGPLVELRFEPGRMFERGPDGLPTGRLVAPSPRPWDDCFIEVRTRPRLIWPGAISLELSSSADHWVVYDEPEHAICVEPQTAQPDDVNLGPRTVVTAGASFEATMAWRWWTAGQADGSQESPDATADHLF